MEGHSRVRLAKRFIVVSAALVLAGCQTLTEEHMRVRDGAIPFDGHAFEGAIQVDEVTTESETLERKKFAQALGHSLAGQNLIASQADGAGYELEARVTAFDPPETMGWTFSSRLRVNYVLTMIGDDEPTIDEIVESRYSASPGSENVGQDIAMGVLFGAGSSSSTTDSGTDTDPARDRYFGYPRDGVPLTATNGSTRWFAVIETTARKNIARFIEVMKYPDRIDGSPAATDAQAPAAE